MNFEGSIESIYQKKTQIEHILLRPDSYVGSIDSTSAQLWVMLPNEEKFTQKFIEYVPGLYKIFDEILVNAADNYQRDKSMDTIKVTISKEKNSIAIWNNGKGIPVQIHKEYNIYVPELIFGHLLTSSNYDDTKKKVTGGRNGYGAKLTNIFSKKFIVQTADSKSKKLFSMTWKDNMSNCSKPQIDTFNGEDYTCITFEPDLKRFGMKELDDDIIALMTKRVYDLAGVISDTIKVYINNKRISIKGFSQYCDLYLKENKESDRIKLIDKTRNERWECIISTTDDQFQQVSFVNSICTTKGGTHVNYVIDQIVDKLMETIKKKHKNLNVKPFQIKNHLWIFLNCLIENPAFDSQTKETLTLKAAQFGSKYELSEKFLKEILKCGVLEKIILQAKMKEEAKMAKTLSGSKKSKLLGIPKLEDANDAGTRFADQCTLILTEGDSAKSLAMAGIEVVGRDKYGVFPLKGKLLNVREATPKQISDNQEIQSIIKILGLQVGKKYEDIRNLRYGSLMIMADQDHDGSHIKGLIINFIHHFWPSLLHINGFLKEFVTPLIKATKNTQVQTFFTVNDYKTWAETVEISQWKIKYYKGLGTSTDKEAQEYFNNLRKHQLTFKYGNNEDDEAIELAFSKKKVDDRKEWLAQYNPNNFVDHRIHDLRYVDFINKELIQFSMSDNIRSIPSICDGLKPGQRKILFSCFKRNLKNEIKVAQLAGYVAEHSAYHHGEQSLAQTIVGMAQNFVGSNNINLLMPIGQFGSRMMGGKEAASARYIFTNLNKATRMLFNENDDHLYKYLEDDGQSVEPEWYLPIIPLVLVNGADGIGTGWSTSIPCYNPREICEYIKKKLNEEEVTDLHPWFKNYTGKIEQISKNNYSIAGKYEIIDDETIRITELPIRKWTKDYKSFLEGLMNPEQGEADILDIKEYHSLNTIDFIIKLAPGKLREIEKCDGIEKKFKLGTTLSTSNLVLFDHNNNLKKYSDPKEIIDEFYDIRLKFYEKRKSYLLSKLKRDLEIIKNKKNFISSVINNQIQIRNVKRKVLIENLIKNNFQMMKDIAKIESTKPNAKEINITPEIEENESRMDIEHEENDRIAFKEYNYLLNLPIWSLTYEEVEKLNQEYNKKEQEFKELESITIKEMYERDISNVLKILDENDDIEQNEKKNAKKPKVNINTLKRSFTSKTAVKKTSSKKTKKTMDSDEEDEYSDNDDDFNDKDLGCFKKIKPKELKQKKKELKCSSQEKPNNSDKKPTLELKVVSQTITSTNNHTLEKKVNDKEPLNKEKAENKNEVSSKNSTVTSPNIDKTKEKEKKSNDLQNKSKIEINNSILKYLVKSNLPQSNSQPSIKSQKEDQSNSMSLLERIQFRESKGDLLAFNEAYTKSKQKPTTEENNDESNLGKRKSEITLEKESIKKVKSQSEDDDFNLDDLFEPKKEKLNNENTLLDKEISIAKDIPIGIINRPRRSTATRKKLIDSPDNMENPDNFEERVF